MGSGASSTKPRSAPSAELSKSPSARKASPITCSRCAEQVGSSTFRMGDRPLCDKCGGLRQAGLLYVCTVCDGIHKYSRKGGARTGICSSCESQMRSPAAKVCTQCGGIRKIVETPAAKGRCAACWMRGGSGLTIALPDEDCCGPVVAVPTQASAASTTAPPSSTSRVASSSLYSKASGALTSNASYASAQSTPASSFRERPRRLQSSTTMKTATTTTSLTVDTPHATPKEKDAMMVAMEKTLPVGGTRGLLRSRSSSSSLGSLGELTLASAKQLAMVAVKSFDSNEDFLRASRLRQKADRKADRTSQPRASRSRTAPSNPRPKTPKTPSSTRSKSRTLQPTLSEPINHLDRTVHTPASNPLAGCNIEHYHIGNVGLDKFHHRTSSTQRAMHRVRAYLTFQRIRMGLNYGNGYGYESE